MIWIKNGWVMLLVVNPVFIVAMACPGVISIRLFKVPHWLRKKQPKTKTATEVLIDLLENPYGR